MSAGLNPREEPIRSENVVCRGPGSHGGRMGRGILLWLLGVPIPIIILLALFWH